ncbi:MAG: ABC transporter substrate-binding protein [Ardenticatenaceae bacterium]|nr:ABC transporter substrate-binding protein [Ardenticatenaceae bacterium]
MSSEHRVSGMDRRTLLKLLGITGAGLVLPGCTGRPAAPAAPTAAPAAAATSAPAATSVPAAPKAASNNLVIAFNDEIASLDPNGINRNLTQLSPHMAIWDHLIFQDRDLNYQPGVIKSWEWSDDKLSLDLEVQDGIKFHNGDPLTAEDVAFTFERMAQDGKAYSGIWKNIKNIQIKDDHHLTLTLEQLNPALVPWMGFLDGLVIPKNYFQEVGEEGFLKNPIGAGPYKFKEFVPGSHLALEAFEDYWRGPASIKNVTYKIVTDSTARAAEVESASADFTVEVPIADFERLSSVSGLTGVSQPVTDVAVLFVSPYFEPFGDENVRKAIHYAIDKDAITKDVLLGFGRSQDTTETPLYMAYPEGYTFPYDLEKAKELLAGAGYTPDNPLKMTVLSTNGFKTRDYDVMQALVGMWSKVGVQADIETVTIPQFFELRSAAKIPSLALYFWSNATGDPINSVGLSNFPPSPFSVWKGDVDYTGLKDELTAKLAPIFSEPDEEKRIAAAKEGAIYVAEHVLMLPLYQVISPIVMKEGLQYEPYPQGWILPYDMEWAG